MKHLHLISLLFAAAAVFAACDNTLGTDDDIETVIEDEEYDFHTIVRTKSDTEMTKAVNTFCFNLYNAGFDAEDNTLWSPISISTAMTMTSVGANGQTLTELINTLGFSQMTMDDINDYYDKVLKALLSADSSVSLSVNNSAWISELHKEKIKTSYTQQISTFYDAEINYADFSMSENASKTINDWCSQKTDGKIEEIIHSGDINADTKLVLLNTLLFDAKWSSDNTFDEKDSFPDAFLRMIPVTMMSGRFDLPYYEDDKLQAVSLPFGNGAFRLTVVLPDKSLNFSDFAKNINQAQWDQIKGDMVTKNISVAVPKFIINYDADIKDTMSKLGIKLAFDPLQADLSGIEHSRSLYVTKVNHSTKLGVDESGATAAAATAVIHRAGANLNPVEGPSPYDFYAYHPFMFVIEEASTGTILFIGNKLW